MTLRSSNQYVKNPPTLHGASRRRHEPTVEVREPRPDKFWTADLVEAWLVEMWDTDRRLDSGQLAPGSF